jgi:Protein of unknown function (DUF5818)
MSIGIRKPWFLAAALGSLLLPMFALVPPAAAQAAKKFDGEVTDEHLNCIQTPMKAPAGITQKDACVLYWAHFVQPPSKYVLYDAKTKTKYQLDDQNLVQPYVGEKVQVTGTLDPATKTIKVSSIKVPTETKNS